MYPVLLNGELEYTLAFSWVLWFVGGFFLVHFWSVVGVGYVLHKSGPRVGVFGRLAGVVVALGLARGLEGASSAQGFDAGACEVVVEEGSGEVEAEAT